MMSTLINQGVGGHQVGISFPPPATPRAPKPPTHLPSKYMMSSLTHEGIGRISSGYYFDHLPTYFSLTQAYIYGPPTYLIATCII
jgi:hypothetical protein